ncbi:MAG: matrixin family metalloprotease [Planctomycetota bacterium]|nr:matrixin family metalloprotease [Planctomycetota bacterium]
MRRGAYLAGAAFAVLALIVASGVTHASVVKQSIPDLIRQADVVVHGRVTDTTSFWQGTTIVTEVTIDVKTTIFGSPGNQVIVTLPGGIVGDIGLEVSDTPEFQRGKESVVFLGNGRNGDFQVLGAVQGKVDVVGGNVPAWNLPLDEFIARVAAGGIGLEEHAAKPPGTPGGGGGGKGDKGDEACYLLCKIDWKRNGEQDNDGIYSPKLEDDQGGNWSINNNSQDWPNDDAALVAELGDSAKVWTDNAGARWSLGALNATVTHDSRLTNASFDGRNVVSFGYTGNAVAVTANWFYRNARKHTIETDFLFNDIDNDFGINVPESNSEFDLKNVAVHEFGHWICLGDQYNDSDFDHVMYGFVEVGETKNWTLHQCDMDGAQAVYGTP